MWIFLDIDGVLVPEKKFDISVGKEDLLRFDPVCLQIFEDVLQRYPDALVVISSSWREVFPFERNSGSPPAQRSGMGKDSVAV